MNNTRFKNKSVLITGAGSGIGQEAARQFALEGALVIGIDRSLDGLNRTADQILSDGGRFEMIAADISEEKAVADAFRHALTLSPRIDCAFNNAGVTQSAAVTADITLAEWEKLFSVNVTGLWLCMREEIRHMAACGAGVIVNTASFLSMRGMMHQSAYTASKHAVLGLTRNAALEYAAAGIRINAVAPGGVPTGMMAESLSALAEADRAAARQGIAELHPMKRLGTPMEIARSVMFLCSDDAAFITGTCLSVDGGWSAQ